MAAFDDRSIYAGLGEHASVVNGSRDDKSRYYLNPENGPEYFPAPWLGMAELES